MHLPMREQTYFVVSLPRRFAFGELDQCTTNAFSMKTRTHCDVVQKQMVGVWNKYQNPCQSVPSRSPRLRAQEYACGNRPASAPEVCRCVPYT